MNTRFLRLAKSPKSTAKPKISSDEVFENMAILYSKRPQRSKDHRTGLGIFFGGPELPKNQKNQKNRGPFGVNGARAAVTAVRPPAWRSDRRLGGPTAGTARRPPAWRADRRLGAPTAVSARVAPFAVRCRKCSIPVDR